MKEYIVYVKGVWLTPVRIVAESEEDARRRVEVGEGLDGDLFSSSIFPPEDWKVKETEKKEG